MAGKKAKYQIWGKIIEKESGKGVPNITVKAYDKDLRYDDSLGESITDRNGRFVINYSEKDFRDLYVFDRKPDLYLTIFDWLGTRIKSTKNRIRYNAKPREGFYIKLPKSVVSKIPQPKKKTEEKPKKAPKKMKLKTKALKKKQLKVKGIPLEDIPGIGPTRAKKLNKAGISDAKAFSKVSEKKLKEVLGNLDIKKMKRDCDKVIKKSK
jgi:predicted flap endonuclease-1-like 5' DNA nuclease